MKTKHILVVDDDAITRHLLKSFLKNESQYDVESVENGGDCLNFVKDHDVDLIISDVEMDDIDGLQISKALLSQKETAQIPVILSSIRDKSEIKMKSRDYSNVKKVIQKPYDRYELISDLKNILNS